MQQSTNKNSDESSEPNQANDILNIALEESGLNMLENGTKEKIAEQDETPNTSTVTANDSSDDPFSSTPFKLLFSTFGGNQSNEKPPEAENLTSTLDPDEFLQKHFQ